jgi:hypothetical protein
MGRARPERSFIRVVHACDAPCSDVRSERVWCEGMSPSASPSPARRPRRTQRMRTPSSPWTVRAWLASVRPVCPPSEAPWGPGAVSDGIPLENRRGMSGRGGVGVSKGVGGPGNQAERSGAQISRESRQDAPARPCPPRPPPRPDREGSASATGRADPGPAPPPHDPAPARKAAAPVGIVVPDGAPPLAVPAITPTIKEPRHGRDP